MDMQCCSTVDVEDIKDMIEDIKDIEDIRMRNHENLDFPNSHKLGNVCLKVTYVFRIFSKRMAFGFLRRPAVTRGTHCTRTLAVEDAERIKDVIDDVKDVDDVKDERS